MRPNYFSFIGYSKTLDGEAGFERTPSGSALQVQYVDRPGGTLMTPLRKSIWLFTRRWYINKLGIFRANQKSTCLDPHQKWGWYSQTCLSPPVNFLLTNPRRCFFFVICVSCLSCYLVCSLQPCGHLLGKGWPLGFLVCDVNLCVFFFTFPCGVLGQV